MQTYYSNNILINIKRKKNCFLFVLSNVTSICCIFLASCTPLTLLQSDLFPVFARKVMSCRLHYIVGFTLLGSLYPVVTQAITQHPNLILFFQTVRFFLFSFFLMDDVTSLGSPSVYDHRDQFTT